ncbi:MAG: nuclear transport factor 2 family protein [Phycisphaerae bacterium]|nr:nuclear transport factor 2 family protein [Gemmatimonadaceae bacterium]
MLSLMLGLALASRAAAAQPVAVADTALDRRLVAALVDSSLAALSRGNLVAFTDYMVDEAITMSVSTRNGQSRHSARSRLANRTMAMPGKITERAFRTQVQVAGPIATAWAPYDLYIDDKWSHCGVDVFTVIKTGGVWKIATLVWSVEQPPACARHPDGPPKPL